MGDWRMKDDGWFHDPDAPSPGRQPATSMLPATEPTQPTGDVGDWIDPAAPDPTPDEVVDIGDPNYVAPWRPE